MKKLSLFAAAAVAASTLAVAPAQANEVRVHVNYADLDITSADGAATLASRIETGVNKACSRSGDLRDISAIAVCQDTLRSEAISQLNGQNATLVAASLATQG